MKNTVAIQILSSLQEINSDRILIYSLVKNEIVYEDLKTNLDSCIKKSLIFKTQLDKEINRITTKEKHETVENQEFFNVWLVINKGLSVYKRKMIKSLFSRSEDVFKTTYSNALNQKNLKHLSSRHKNLIWKQKELLNAC